MKAVRPLFPGGTSGFDAVFLSLVELFYCPSKQEQGPELCSSSQGK